MGARPARTAGREAAERPEATRLRPPVRDFSGGGSQVIEWDVRPAYDLIFSLSGDAGSTEDLPAEDRRWLSESRASLTAAQRKAVARLFDSEVCILIGEFVMKHREARTADELVSAVEAAGPVQVLRSVFSDLVHDEGKADEVDAALWGDARALADVSAHMPDRHKEERLAILRAPAATYGDVVGVLRAWAERFQPIEARVTTILKRDYELRAEDRATLSAPDLIERTTGGVRWLPEARTRRVILAPSYFSRPYNFVLSGDDWRFFGYPVADAALDRTDPLAAPQAVVRLHRALGDETRLKILKLLADKDLYMTEIAQQLELSKPTIKHHLALLRAAGLVTITEAGAVTYYSLRRGRLDDASTELKSFLIH